MNTSRLHSRFFARLLVIAIPIATPLFGDVQIVNTSAAQITAMKTGGDPLARADALFESLKPMTDLYAELVGIHDLKENCQRAAPQIQSQVDALRNLTENNRLETEINQHLARFTQRFPDFRGSDVTVYFLPSFGRFQAQSRVYHNQPVLLLASDFVATSGRGHVSPVLIHHELFHLYHGQVCPGFQDAVENFFSRGQPTRLGDLLWAEGLAVEMAHSLNPTATDEELYPSAEMARAVRAAFMPLLQRAMSEVDVASPTAISGFFYFPRQDQAQIPLNCGYVLGARLVRQMLLTHSLEEVMTMRGPTLSTALHAAADELAAQDG